MTENKRFIPVYKCVTQDNEVYVVCKGEHDADVVATALNEFYERNEYLEKENKELKKRISDLQKENYGNIDGIAFYQEENASLCEKISDLECENEKLKEKVK